jgi:mono/diheme cytochrome c family protein
MKGIRLRSLMTWAMILAGLALVLTACGGGTPAPTSAPAATAAPTGDAARGKTLFEGTCAACHGPDAKGLPNLGKNLVTSEFAKGKTDAELVDFIKTGRPISDPANTTGVEMPPRGGNQNFTDQDLFDIVAYIRTLEAAGG